MAEQCGLSRTRFSHYCLKLTNLAPMAFIFGARLSKAKKLLTETDLRIAEIAGRCGFQSAAYFTKKFRSVTGITPRDYRLGQAAASD
jgi:AraC family L-rhamnose operon regulatory protein RhaS